MANKSSQPWKAALTGSSHSANEGDEGRTREIISGNTRFVGNFDNNNSLQVAINRLNGRNYIEWAQSVRLVLNGKRKFGYLTRESIGHESEPTSNHQLESVSDFSSGYTKSQSRKDIPPSQNGFEEKGPDDIQLLQTDALIKEVERIFGASHHDHVEMGKAKKILKEHEQALTDAIAKLGGLSDSESE